jgi:hypothetical protein
VAPVKSPVSLTPVISLSRAKNFTFKAFTSLQT